MSDPGQELARTRSDLPAQAGADTHRADPNRADPTSWQDILAQLESDVSRAEQLTVGMRMIGQGATPEGGRQVSPPSVAGSGAADSHGPGSDLASSEGAGSDLASSDWAGSEWAGSAGAGSAGAGSDEALARLSVPLPDIPWQPPQGHPPMPAHYAERARALLDRQIAIAAHITREITMGRQQAAYAHHIEGLKEAHATPAFIDEVT